jgi:hypothetical protein
MTGVVLFATERVFDETMDRFDEIATSRSVQVEDVERVWDRVFAPRVRIVRMDDVHVVDWRVDDVAGRDKDDLPTAALAVLLAPCFLLTDNLKHFQAFGMPATHPSRPEMHVTTAFSLDVREFGEFLEALNVGTLPIRLGGIAAVDGGKALVRWLGRDVALAIALLLLGGVALYWRSPSGRRLRASVEEAVATVTAEHGEDIARVFESGTAVGERLAAYAVLQGKESPLSIVARRLVSQSVLTTVQIADSLRLNGYGYSPANSHRQRVRAWLSAQPCLWESARGQWILGYHPAPFFESNEP